jgi:fucose 4-O-acetylase-like acetyltransferase
MTASTHAAPRAGRPGDPSTASPGLDLSRRDLVVDLARVVCVLLVVVIHVLMVGVAVDAEGAVTATQPLTEQPWFALSTWAGQVMPLFFVLGGFASATSWASARRRGATASEHVAGRLVRLARPAVPVFVVLAVALATATLLGVDPGLLDVVATGVGSPLWFLAAYAITQVAVPTMARLHETRPGATFGVLAAAAVLVDAARWTTGVTDVGLLNLVFVWLFVQQLGFAVASGWLRHAPRPLLVAVAAACWLSLPVLTTVGPWSADMLTNLNPPTVPLMVLGVGQICVLTLLRPLLERLMSTTAARAVVLAVGSRGMTIYLWHLPLLIAVLGVCLALGGPLPEPGSGAWWWSRLPVALLVVGLACAVSLLTGRLEQPPRRRGGTTVSAPVGVVVVAAVLVVAPPFAVMLWGLDLPLAVFGAVALPLAVRLLAPRASAEAGEG